MEILTNAKAQTNKILLVIIAVLVLFIAGFVLMYLYTIDTYVREQAQTIGQLQSRVSSLEDRLTGDESDIDNLYNDPGTNSDPSNSGIVIPPGAGQRL